MEVSANSKCSCVYFQKYLTEEKLCSQEKLNEKSNEKSNEKNSNEKLIRSSLLNDNSDRKIYQLR